MFLPGLSASMLSGVPYISPDFLRTVIGFSFNKVTGLAAPAGQVQIPTDVVAGDVLLMYAQIDGTNQARPAVETCPGWTAITDARSPITNFSSRHCISYRIAQSGDAGSMVGVGATGWVSPGTVSRLLVCFRGNIPIVGATFGSVTSYWRSVIPTTNPPAQTVAASAVVPPFIVIGHYQLNGIIDPRTFYTTPGGLLKDGEWNFRNGVGSGATDSWFAYKAFDVGGVAPSDVVVDMDNDGPTQIMSSFYIKFT